MLGDLFSSFLKRRLSFTSGDAVPGLDQIPEGLLPFLLIAPYYSLSPGYVLLFGFAFGLGAYYGSVFLNRILLGRPFESYPRRIRALTRFRELISCQITAKPFPYLLNFEDAIYYHLVMKYAFKALGVYERGKQNALAIEKREVSFHLADLPRAFDGYKILFLSDLHLDGLEGLTEKLIEIVRQTPADLCILGGDFRMETYGPFVAGLRETLRLIPEIRAKDGILGVLGNHDCLEIVDSLRGHGVTFLVNDSREIKRDGQCIWIAGVDDCHYSGPTTWRAPSVDCCPWLSPSLSLIQMKLIEMPSNTGRISSCAAIPTPGRYRFLRLVRYSPTAGPPDGFARENGIIKACLVIRAPG